MLDVSPPAIPEGEGRSLPVQLLGDIGFRNYQGLLVLIVPAAVAEVVRQELGEEIAAKQAAGPRFVEAVGRGGYVAEFAVRLRVGMRKAVPLGTCGEIGMPAFPATTGSPLSSARASSTSTIATRSTATGG